MIRGVLICWLLAAATVQAMPHSAKSNRIAPPPPKHWKFMSPAEKGALIAFVEQEKYQTRGDLEATLSHYKLDALRFQQAQNNGVLRPLAEAAAQASVEPAAKKAGGEPKGSRRSAKGHGKNLQRSASSARRAAETATVAQPPRTMEQYYAQRDALRRRAERLIEMDIEFVDNPIFRSKRRRVREMIMAETPPARRKYTPKSVPAGLKHGSLGFRRQGFDTFLNNLYSVTERSTP